jgi:hypothetical protein
MTRLLMVSTVAPTLRAFLLPFARHFRAQGWQMVAVYGSARKHGEHTCPLQLAFKPGRFG